MSHGTFADLDLFTSYPRIGGLALSPDGARLVTGVQTLSAKRDKYVTALWEIDPAGERPARRITRSAHGESGPVFAANGDLYFTSARPDEADGKDDAALWCLPAAGGEAHVVNRRPGGVTGVLAAEQADTVAATGPMLPGAEDEEAHAALQKGRKEASVQAILHSSYPVRFWDHDLGPAEPTLFVLGAEEEHDGANSPEPARRALRAVTKDLGARFSDAVLTPDGSRALVGLRIPEAKADMRSCLAVVNLATGESRVLADDPERNFSAGPVSPDSTRAAIVVSTRPTPQAAMIPQMHVIDLKTGELTQVGTNVDLWLSPAAWLPEGSEFLATGDTDGRGPIFRVSLSTGDAVQVTHDDATYTDVRVSPDGKTAYGLRSSYLFPAETVRVDLSTGEAQRLQNPVDRPEIPGTLTEVETRAGDGVRVRGWLALPEGASAEKPAPLLLWIHGGPLNSWNAWSWRWTPWAAAARGYAVLLPDPALSTGYGQEFVQRGWNSWGDKPYTDLMDITDAVVAREDVDGARTAAMGGSFGGYMANWVAGHTDRFRAIVTHASLWALDQFGPTTDMSSSWRRQINAEMEAKHSPHSFVESIRTPMFVIHGDKDYRVPIGEGLRLWYELLEKSGLPMEADGSTVHRFLYFPDENHWILKPQHAKVWYQAIFAFLAEHVLGEAGSELLPAELGLTAPAEDA
ncbi:S9 family peptidase [Nesterenkonia populi]|uniref:S9 family peptidase n=1 Tax=Nesterenkonia populi TaxID=1591087 RepID=UPI0011BE9EE9|nr:alpha/beta fold hydrolase [Nesterenkonia populi]